ncbi:MAG: right-handed parallel beta-helix repeat-containing protein [Planctomycetota bacterium]|nr:right-handed parallel beta-helix repeat-containing protein [Planctomycetota bacterium]
MLRSKHSIAALLTIAACCGPSAALQAQTSYYVAPQGVDLPSNGGLLNPFKTITYAANRCQPGDTVLIRGGRHRRADFDDGDIWTTGSVGRIATNGAPGAYITFKAFPGEQPIIEFDASFGVLIQNASYIRVEGLEVVGVAPQITQVEADAAWGLYKDAQGAIHDLAVEMGININDPSIYGTTVSKAVQVGAQRPPYYNGRGIAALNSHHVEIIGNTVRDCTGIGIRAGGCDYVTISRNTLYHNGYWNTFGVGAIDVFGSIVRPAGDTFDGVKMQVDKNVVHSNENRMVSWNPSRPFVNFTIDEGTGIFVTNNVQTYSHGYFLIANNVSAFNGTAGVEFHLSERGVIEHNSLYYNGTRGDGPHGGIGVNHAADVTIANNVAYASADHFALSVMGQPVSDITVAGNVLFNDSSATRDVHRLLPSGWIAADPRFVAPATIDLRLQPTSPAIDIGIANVVQNDDITGAPRGDGRPDAGAYERREPTNRPFAIPLNYNFNGIAHAGELGAPDAPFGYRSISDRGLDFVGGVPSDPVLAKYEVVAASQTLDVVHLGNRDVVSGGAWAFEPTANGNLVGTQPAWLPDVDQSGPQTTQLADPIRMDGASAASLIFQVSGGGGAFEVAFDFANGAQVIETVSGGGWLGGPLPSVAGVDSATTGGPGMSVTEQTIDLSGQAGRVLTAVTFQNADNPDVGYAILAMNVAGCVACANGAQAQVHHLGGGTGPTIATSSTGGLGCDLVWTVSGGVPSAPGVWLLGAGVSSTPVAAITPGCPGSLRVPSPTLLQDSLDASGRATLTVIAPAIVSQALCGYQVTAQHVAIVASSCFVDVSDALAITIGG